MNLSLVRRLSLPLAVACASCSLLLSAPSHAAPESNGAMQITLSPTSTTLDITAGRTYDGSFTIFNSGDVPLHFTVYAAPYQVTSELYDPTFNKETPRTQISRWIQFPRTDYVVAAGKNATVPYTITTPESIPSGGQYAALFAQTEGQANGSIVSQKRVGMLLYARAAGTTKESGEVLPPEFHSLQTSPTFTTTQRIKNTGNVDSAAKVTLTVSDIFGRTKYTQDKTVTILPDTTRAIPFEWKEAPSLAYMNVALTTSYLGKSTNYQHRILFATPTALFMSGALVIVIISGGAYVVKKRAHRTPNKSE